MVCGVCDNPAIVRVELEGVEVDLCRMHWDAEIENGAIANRATNGWRMLQNYRTEKLKEKK